MASSRSADRNARRNRPLRVGCLSHPPLATRPCARSARRCRRRRSRGRAAPRPCAGRGEAEWRAACPWRAEACPPRSAPGQARARRRLQPADQADRLRLRMAQELAEGVQPLVHDVGFAQPLRPVGGGLLGDRRPHDGQQLRLVGSCAPPRWRSADRRPARAFPARRCRTSPSCSLRITRNCSQPSAVLNTPLGMARLICSPSR